MIPVQSSNLAAIGYDPTARVMHVSFRGGGTYHHTDVPPEAYRKFMASPSKGRHYHEHVRDKYITFKLG